MVIQGIQGSLTSSMNMKRDAQGVVDGIVAEDIGKFPDTNLAESLQRISGVSIDRSLGEGSRVTVRGIGPDYNLVLLNGRQMPASSNANGAGISNSRAFDFANLASEAISAVEVYKTSRANTPPGGIGATINIKTARPLDSDPVANIGIKAVNDTSNGNLPDSLQGDDFTPRDLGHLEPDLRRRTLRRRGDRQLPGARLRLQPGRRCPMAGAPSAATKTTGARSRSRARPVRRTSPIAPMPPTSIRCRRT